MITNPGSLLAILQICLAVGNLSVMLYALSKFISKPHNDLTERVAVLEARVNKHESILEDGGNQFEQQNATNEVIIKSLLALIEVQIQDCIIEHKTPSHDLQRAKEDLHNYLAKK